MESLMNNKEFVGVIFSSVAQLAMMFVMLFVRFKMFSIIPLFLIPMAILQVLAICLVGFKICKLLSMYQNPLVKVDFIKTKQVLLDLSFH